MTKKQLGLTAPFVGIIAFCVSKYLYKNSTTSFKGIFNTGFLSINILGIIFARSFKLKSLFGGLGLSNILVNKLLFK